jgi:tetratricopeptide (TPR) repeat protein
LFSFEGAVTRLCSLGKKYFRAADFGLAEQHFRKAVEMHPRDLESWIGLAASYDRLRRFDLADRAYTQAMKIAGATPEILNNIGYSYMLRGDYRRARETLMQAQAQDPGNPYIRNNLELLDASFRKGKAIQYHPKLLVWAMVPLLNCPLKDRRNQFECSILYRLLRLYKIAHWAPASRRQISGTSEPSERSHIIAIFAFFFRCFFRFL